MNSFDHTEKHHKTSTIITIVSMLIKWSLKQMNLSKKIDIAYQIKEINNFDSIQIHLFEQISKPNTV